MQLRQSEATLVTRPVAPPINLDAGRLDIGRAALAGGFVLGALTIATIGIWLFRLSTDPIGGSALGAILGAIMSLVGLIFGLAVLYISVREWTDHRSRVADWHAVALAAYESQGAIETVEQVSNAELSIENPGHFLIAALWIHQRYIEGDPTPFSTRNMYGPIFLAGRRVGAISKTSAERFGQRFAQLGLIQGRSEGQAGEWVPATADEVISLVVRNW